MTETRQFIPRKAPSDSLEPNSRPARPPLAYNYYLSLPLCLGDERRRVAVLCGGETAASQLGMGARECKSREKSTFSEIFPK